MTAEPDKKRRRSQTAATIKFGWGAHARRVLFSAASPKFPFWF